MSTFGVVSWLFLSAVFVRVTFAASAEVLKPPCADPSQLQADLFRRVTEQIQARADMSDLMLRITPLGAVPALVKPTVALLTPVIRSRMAVRLTGVDCTQADTDSDTHVGIEHEHTLWLRVEGLHEAWLYRRDGRVDEALSLTRPTRSPVDMVALQLQLGELADDIDGQWLAQNVHAGGVILRTQIKPKALVERNEVVKVLVYGPGLIVQTEGKALRAGTLGDNVPVLIKGAHESSTARVISKGVLHVEH